MAVLWLRRLDAGLSPRKDNFHSGPAHVEFVVDKVTLRHDFVRVTLFSLSVSLYTCSIIIFMCMLLLRERRRAKRNAPPENKEHCIEKYFQVFNLQSVITYAAD
jgi:hypothetical protein